MFQACLERYNLAYAYPGSISEAVCGLGIDAYILLVSRGKQIRDTDQGDRLCSY